MLRDDLVQREVDIRETGKAVVAESQAHDDQKAVIDQLNNALAEAEQTCILVSPVTSVDFIPEGFGVSVTYVRIPAEKPHVYDVGGGVVALSAASLVSIATAQSGTLADVAFLAAVR
mgnify:CR=1 FL=1